MKKCVEANRATWNSWTRHHVASDFYDVAGFKAGASRRRSGLDDLEIALVGDVRGKSLLHLQCHFGLDTIAWARRGALATGADFSDEAIRAARALASEVRVAAEFVHSDLYDLPRNLDGEFDVVFTSHGVLSWLPDLERWAQVIAHFLKPGGRFYIIEGHPFAFIFEDRGDEPTLRLRYPYFRGPEPVAEEEAGSYADRNAPVRSVCYFWLHTMSQVIGSLARAGLRIESLEEYPYVGWAMFPWMEQREDGSWQLPGGRGDIPLMFSLAASKS